MLACHGAARFVAQARLGLSGAFLCFLGQLVWADAMAKSELVRLEALVRRLETEGLEGWQDLLAVAQAWPEEDEEEEAASELFLRLEELLLKLPPEDQETVVGAFRPLRAEVARRLAEWTNECNDWLSECHKGGLENLLREVESPPHRWYRQCPKARVKAKFLMAVASLVRALLQGSPLVKPHLANPAIMPLAKKIASRLFVLPGLGDVLETWHEGRLACYNATIFMAAQWAAENMKDDLQVALVSAVKRSAPSDGKKALQLQLKEWPMSGCPLARALLEFLISKSVQLGDLGRPLRECPPHSLQPATLRQLLSRLDAFEVGKGSVRLRWEAVAALAYKAVGTKPKAGAAPPAARKPQANPANPGHPGLGALGALGASPSPSPGASPLPEAELRDLDLRFMSRLIRRGLRAGDEDWRQAWTQFCWKKNISSRLSSKVCPPKDMLVTFMQSHLRWQKAPWAKSLLLGEPEVRHTQSQPYDREKTARRREDSVSDWSSSFSESERSRRRSKRRRKEKKISYRDLFNTKHMTPEVMMMRAQMVGVSMVMNSPLAMMGMRNPIMPMMENNWRQAPHPAPGPPPGPPPPPPGPPPKAGVSRPLAKAAAAAARKQQQESTIDMDDL